MLIISVMLSPLSRMRPRLFRVFFLIESSSASSKTRFMYYVEADNFALYPQVGVLEEPHLDPCLLREARGAAHRVRGEIQDAAAQQQQRQRNKIDGAFGGSMSRTFCKNRKMRLMGCVIIFWTLVAMAAGGGCGCCGGGDGGGARGVGRLRKPT